MGPADSELAGELLLVFRERPAELLIHVAGAGGVFQEQLALVGEGRGTFVTLEHPDAVRFLELLHTSAQRGLGDVESLGSIGYAALFHDDPHVLG